MGKFTTMWELNNTLKQPLGQRGNRKRILKSISRQMKTKIQPAKPYRMQQKQYLEGSLH